MSVWGKPLLINSRPGVEASGNPVVFHGNGANLSELTIDMSVVQAGSGTASPDNIRAITALEQGNVVTQGPNIYDATVNPIEQGNIASADGQDSTTSYYNRIRTNGYIPITEQTGYIVSSNVTRVYAHYYDASYGFLTGQSEGWITTPAQISAPAGAAYVRLVLAKASGTISPSEVSSLEISEYQNHLISWGQEVGKQCEATIDVTGGSIVPSLVYIELDGTESWSRVSAGSGGAPYCRFVLPELTWDSTAASALCSHFVEAAIVSTNKHIGIRVYKASNNILYLCLRRTTSDTVANLTSWLAEQYSAGTPVQVAYEISETYQSPTAITPVIVPSVFGRNIVSSNIGALNLKLPPRSLIYMS